MTICAMCIPWCATTEHLLANRLANIARSPGVQTHACLNCGGVEWATTDKFVVREEIMPRNWIALPWREKTWSERAQTVLGWILASAAGLAMLAGAFYVLGMMIDQSDRRNTCLRKAGESVELQRRC